MQKKQIAEGKSVVLPAIEARLDILETARQGNTKQMPPRDIDSQNQQVRIFLQDIQKGQALQINDLFDLLKKILISPEAKNLLGGQTKDAQNDQRYYFNAEFLVRYKEALAANGIRPDSNIQDFLLRAGVSPEHPEYARLQYMLRSILTDEKIELTGWLSAESVFQLITLLLKISGKITAPFDLAENKADNNSFFYFYSVLQDIILESFTNLADVSLEYFKNNFHGQALTVFKIALQDSSLRAYEKLLALLLLLGKFSVPRQALYIYCRDNDRDTLLNSSTFYIAFGWNGSKTGISYAGAIKFIENNYIYLQKLLADLDTEKNNSAVSDFQEITPLLSKALTYLNGSKEITSVYFPGTGFILKLSEWELIVPIVLGQRPGRTVFGLYGEYAHGLENNLVRDGFSKALKQHQENMPDFSIALDYQRLSDAEREYFQKINQIPFAEMGILPLGDYAVRLIERINSPITKGDFIEKVVELLYLNYNNLAFNEKSLFTDRLVLAINNVSATEQVKIVCGDVLRRLADTGKISPHSYKSWTSNELSYRMLELYAEDLLKELKTFQRRRQSYNMTEILPEIFLRFLPLMQNNKSNPAIMPMLDKLWKIGRQSWQNGNARKIETLLSELINTLENLRRVFNQEANRAEESLYKPVWSKAPSSNTLLARIRPLLLDIRNLLGVLTKNKTDNWNLFTQFMHDLNAWHERSPQGQNLIPAGQVIKTFLGTDNLAELEPLIRAEMRSEVKKLLDARGFEQAWHYSGHGSASAFTINSILAYAKVNGITTSALAEDLYKEISAEVGSIPGLSKNSIEDKLLYYLKPDAGVSVNASIEKLLIAIVKLRTKNIYCAYDIGLQCNTPEAIGNAVYTMIKKSGSESAMKLIEGTGTKFHDHKNVRNIAIGSLLLPRNNLGVLALLEFNEKGKNYDLLGTLDILLWTLGAMVCIPQIADDTASKQIAAYIYIEQGQKWEDLKKVRDKLKELLAKPDYSDQEYAQKANALREHLIAVYLGFTFPKGRNGLVRRLVRGSADRYDYLMSSQLLSEAAQKLKDTLSNYHREKNKSALVLQTEQVQQLLNSGEYTLDDPLFVANAGLVQKAVCGKKVEYIIYAEYRDASGRRYLAQRLLNDNSRVLPLGQLKLRETRRSIGHWEQAGQFVK